MIEAPHPPVPLHRRSLLVGVIAGAACALLLSVLSLVVLQRRPERGRSPAPYQVHIGKGEVQLDPGAAQPVPTQTVPVVAGPPLPPPAVTGRVAPVEARTAPSFAPLPGRVERVAVALGDTVTAGARLALVRSVELPAMLRELRAGLATARTKAALVERMKVLVEARGASANDLLVAQNELRDAQLTAQAAEARLSSLAIAREGDNLYWVLANRAGAVIQLDAVPGAVVGPGKERPLATVADLAEVLVLADVTPQDAAALRPGEPVTVAQPGSEDPPLPGAIESVSQVVDPDRQTVPVRVRVRNEGGRLRPNAFVSAVFETGGGEPVLRVPSEAVVSDGLKAVVFVQVAPGRFRRTPVTLGHQRQGMTEIRSGLSSGAQVVSQGAILLLNALDLNEDG